MKKGFTLIETIMAMVIIGIVSAILSAVIYGGMNTWLFIKDQRKANNEATLAVRQMVREIKLTSPSRISAFSATALSFTDINGNSIAYAVSSNNLTRNGVVLLPNLKATDGLTFTYFTKTGAVAATASQIETIIISLVVQNGTKYVEMQSGANLREQ
jgi:prepilin-type N-terminal cleavage/methylation domain-containing protein